MRRLAPLLLVAIAPSAAVAEQDSVPDPVFSAPMTALFDAPLARVRVTVPPRETDDPRGAVRCFTYPGFVVKEIDYGQHGDDEILVSVPGHGAPVKCDAAIDARQMTLSGSAESYFLGAKGRYGFTLSTLGGDGSPFTIHDLNADHDFSIGGALFTDTLAADTAPSNVAVADGVLTVDYTASASSFCSILTGGTACWKKIAGEANMPASLANTPPPVDACKAGYADVEAKEPSVLTFAVHLTIDAADKITATAGPVLSCKPQA